MGFPGCVICVSPVARPRAKLRATLSPIGFGTISAGGAGLGGQTF
jgi:hypothetical protein